MEFYLYSLTENILYLGKLLQEGVNNQLVLIVAPS